MLLITSVLTFIMFLIGCEAMTMKQVKNTGKMMRKSCQPKFDLTDDKIDPINNGVFVEDKDIKCYIACVMKMANGIKNNKFSYESSMKQADLILPDDLKEPAKIAITACKKVGDPYKDICDAAFHVTKCIYEQNPGIFYFP